MKWERTVPLLVLLPLNSQRGGTSTRQILMAVLFQWWNCWVVWVGVGLHGPARAFRQHSRTVQGKPRETRALTEPSPSVGAEPWLGSHHCCFPESDPSRRAATTEAREKAAE